MGTPTGSFGQQPGARGQSGTPGHLFKSPRGRQRRPLPPEPEPPRVIWDPLTGNIESDYERTEPPAEDFQWEQPEPAPAQRPRPRRRGLPDPQQTNPNKMWDDPPDLGAVWDQLGNMFGGAVDWVNETFPGGDETPMPPMSPLGAGGPPPAERSQGTRSPPTNTSPSFSPFPGVSGPPMKSGPAKSDQQRAIEEEAGVPEDIVAMDPRTRRPITRREVEGPEGTWPGDQQVPSEEGPIHQEWRDEEEPASLGEVIRQTEDVPPEGTWPGDQQTPSGEGPIHQRWKEEQRQREEGIRYIESYLDSLDDETRIRRMKKFDRDGDGLLNDDELYGMLTHANKVSEGKGYRDFRHWRKNRDENNRVAEKHDLSSTQMNSFTQIGKEYFQQIPPEDRSALIDKYDRDGDGKITGQDLMDFIYNEVMTNVQGSLSNPEIRNLRIRAGRAYGIDYFSRGHHDPNRDAGAGMRGNRGPIQRKDAAGRGGQGGGRTPLSTSDFTFNHETHLRIYPHEKGKEGGRLHLDDSFGRDNNLSKREEIAVRNEFQKRFRAWQVEHNANIHPNVITKGKNRGGKGAGRHPDTEGLDLNSISPDAIGAAEQIMDEIMTGGLHRGEHDKLEDSSRAQQGHYDGQQQEWDDYAAGRGGQGGGRSITGHRYPKRKPNREHDRNSRGPGRSATTGSSRSGARPPVFPASRGPQRQPQRPPAQVRGGGYTPGRGPQRDDGGVDVSQLPPWHPLRIRAEGKVPGKFQGPAQESNAITNGSARDARDSAYRDYIWQGYSENEARKHASKIYKDALRWQNSGRQ